MIVLKSKEEIALMRESGRITGWILEALASLIKPGMTTAEIAAAARRIHAESEA